MKSGCQTAAVIGAGIAGIATAYYLSREPKIGRIRLIDAGQPMAFTSAQSGENYRNWWPHPTMTAFTDLSIDRMEDLARECGNRFALTRRGYALATRRAEIGELMETLFTGYSSDPDGLIRVHDTSGGKSYRPSTSAEWQGAPDGVDVITSTDLIRRTFPNFSDDVRAVVHIRRAGDISGQQLGQYMLDQARGQGLERMRGTVCGLECSNGFGIHVDDGGERRTVESDIVVNAAGPLVNEVGSMLGYTLPVRNVLQQKIAFDDRARSIARDTPFSIDLDGQSIDWSEEDRQVLLEDPDNAWLAREMPGGIHCKAEGGEHGTWVKLGWAYNAEAADPDRQPTLDDRFPEIVLRGAARLHPALKAYYGRLPRQMSHYGGYYTMTDENWPLLGPAGPEGSFVVSALSGFGTMAACGAGFLAARVISGGSVPPFLPDLTLQRYDKPEFVSGLVDVARTSIL